jgi:hypothetical protein
MDIKAARQVKSQIPKKVHTPNSSDSSIIYNPIGHLTVPTHRLDTGRKNIFETPLKSNSRVRATGWGRVMKWKMN